MTLGADAVAILIEETQMCKEIEKETEGIQVNKSIQRCL